MLKYLLKFLKKKDETNTIPISNTKKVKKPTSSQERERNVSVKEGYVYILKCDGGYKIGRAKNTSKRIKELQTANVNDIQLVYQYKTYNCIVLEHTVHLYLKEYRHESGREFFNCDVEHMKKTIVNLGDNLDKIKEKCDTDKQLKEILLSAEIKKISYPLDNRAIKSKYAR